MRQPHGLCVYAMICATFSGSVCQEEGWRWTFLQFASGLLLKVRVEEAQFDLGLKKRKKNFGIASWNPGPSSNFTKVDFFLD